MAKIKFEFDYYEDRELIDDHNRISKLLKLENDLNDYFRHLYKYEDRVIIPVHEIEDKINDLFDITHDNYLSKEDQELLENHCKEFSDKWHDERKLTYVIPKNRLTLAANTNVKNTQK